MTKPLKAAWRFGPTRPHWLSVTLILLILGCSQPQPIDDTTADAIPAVEQSDDDLKKKIGITRFENRAVYLSKAFSDAFQQNLTLALTEECPRARIISPNDQHYPDSLFTPPKRESGRIDNLKLIQNGRKYGLQSVVAGAITSINANEEDTGYLWFKDKNYFIRVEIIISIYDTETGAKLIDKNISRDIEVDVFDVDVFRQKKRIDTYMLEEAFEEITLEISEAICDQAMDQPWKGFIASLKDKRVFVSAGEDDGLLPGLILDVYRSETIIKGVDDQQFYLPGKRVGIVKIVKVSADQAEAVLLNGKVIQPGDLVKLRE